MKDWKDLYFLIMARLTRLYFNIDKENNLFHCTKEQHDFIKSNWSALVKKWSMDHLHEQIVIQPFFDHYKLKLKLIQPPEDIV